MNGCLFASSIIHFCTAEFYSMRSINKINIFKFNDIIEWRINVHRFLLLNIAKYLENLDYF